MHECVNIRAKIADSTVCVPVSDPIKNRVRGEPCRQAGPIQRAAQGGKPTSVTAADSSLLFVYGRRREPSTTEGGILRRRAPLRGGGYRLPASCTDRRVNELIGRKRGT